jgi:hypothetical protein
MPAANYNFFIEQGATFKSEMIFKDEDGNLTDLTGYTYEGQIRLKYDSSSPVATFTITVANQLTDRGKITISMSPAVTGAIPCDPSTSSDARPITRYVYDVECTKPSGDVDRILQGIVSVSPNVTR